MNMKIAIGSDHAGFAYKEEIKLFLSRKNIEFVDFGTKSIDSTDYPLYAEKVASSVRDRQADLGILVCGTGIGMSIAANKQKGVRAAACQSAFAVRASREHNNANVLCVGSRTNTIEEVLEFVELFVNTPFSNGERHVKRIELIRKIEEDRS
jgi:ribose 5-phosphate isomerase B